ncbi:Tetratricopeptide repeat-like superfamily protein, putative isoform 1 [Theobroma cacao]|uniref:Tetratricopeptide repeat-like superfamily protein, putative isoform 1 n=2 Tax=Theobroma cacao TaxID=3641 RepID=A0A061DPH6_THECC|nr:Tetratricopeptide repeat-like superfamily protein, putative isoform 1 [Theobroma cacao]
MCSQNYLTPQASNHHHRSTFRRKGARKHKNMLLRSSSTPLLGSLLSSITDSPSNNNHYETSTPIRHYPSTSFHHNHNRISFHPSPGSLHLSTTVSCGSSPISPSVVHQFSDFDRQGFRRAQSEGNLEGLVHAACDTNEDFYNHNQPKKLSARHQRLMLQTIPSFSFYNSNARCEEEEDESDLEEEEEELKENEELLDSGEERVTAMNGNLEFNAFRMENILLNEEVKGKSWNVGFEDEGGLVGEKMFLARGLSTDGGSAGGVSGGSGGGGGGEFNPAGSGGDGANNHGVEEHYRRMVEENPGNPLFLGNYAQFLYQSKKDLEAAEEYYSRAILADPKDGETLSQYAKLVWELHHDQERASSYFERAVQASPQDSHVHAAYASFLWETEEDEADGCAAPSGSDKQLAWTHSEGSVEAN